MAFDPTKLLEARAAIEAATSGKMNNNELRVPNYQGLRAFEDQTPGLIAADISGLKQSTEQPVKIPVFQKIAAGSATARACTGTGTGNTAFVTPSWSGITETMSISALEQAANMVGRDRAFQYLFAEKTKAIYKRLNDACLAFLESNKATVNSGTFFGAIDGTDNSKKVAWPDREDLFSGASAELEAMDFMGPYTFVGDFNMKQVYNKITAQGTANDENVGYSTSEWNPYFANVSKAAGAKAGMYAFSPGTVGIFPWTNALSRQGQDIGTDSWGVINLPAMPGMPQGLQVEVKIKRECADNSGTTDGAEADYVESYVLHVDYALLSAYTSTAADTYIYKYEVLNPA
jgi:hypothetical protein